MSTKYPKTLIVIPAYNEEALIQSTLLRLDRFIEKKLSHIPLTIVISDNNSNDATREKILELLPEMPWLGYVFIPQQGKGNAIKEVWHNLLNDYDSFFFMDADLATDLEALPRALEALVSHDAVCGDRYHPDSRVERIAQRKIISSVYRSLIRNLLHSAVSDYPCGFKGFKRETLAQTLPFVENMTWFFDSELAYYTAQHDFSVCNLPLSWKDPRSKIDQSKVSIPKVSTQYLKEIIRLITTKKSA